MNRVRRRISPTKCCTHHINTRDWFLYAKSLLMNTTIEIFICFVVCCLFALAKKLYAKVIYKGNCLLIDVFVSVFPTISLLVTGFTVTNSDAFNSRCT